MHKIIDLIPVLDAADVARVHADVHAARPRWTRRDPVHPFFTLGAASYLDARKGQFAHYQSLARAGNPELAATFGWVHEKLRRAVSDGVGSEARYDDRLALPGFHVHLRDPEQVIPPASIHFDLQFELIDWTQLGVADGREQLSLTLAIALPAEGGGLMVWNINRMDIEAMTDEARREHMRANRHADAASLHARPPRRALRPPAPPDGAGPRSAADRRAHHDAGARAAGRRAVDHLLVGSLQGAGRSAVGRGFSVSRVSTGRPCCRRVLDVGVTCVRDRHVWTADWRMRRRQLAVVHAVRGSPASRLDGSLDRARRSRRAAAVARVGADTLAVLDAFVVLGLLGVYLKLALLAPQWGAVARFLGKQPGEPLGWLDPLGFFASDLALNLLLLPIVATSSTSSSAAGASPPRASAAPSQPGLFHRAARQQRGRPVHLRARCCATSSAGRRPTRRRQPTT